MAFGYVDGLVCFSFSLSMRHNLLSSTRLNCIEYSPASILLLFFRKIIYFDHSTLRDRNSLLLGVPKDHQP